MPAQLMAMSPAERAVLWVARDQYREELMVLINNSIVSAFDAQGGAKHGE